MLRKMAVMSHELGNIVVFRQRVYHDNIVQLSILSLISINSIGFRGCSEVGTARLEAGYGLASVPVQPNTLLVIYYCIIPNRTCYRTGTRPTPSFGILLCLLRLFCCTYSSGFYNSEILFLFQPFIVTLRHCSICAYSNDSERCLRNMCARGRFVLRRR